MGGPAAAWLLWCLLLTPPPFSSAADPVDCTYEPRRCAPIVTQTTLGKMLGLAGGGITSFKGVPFAEAPELFRPAVLKKPWEGTLNATAYGAKCLQSGVMSAVGDAPSSSLIGSADCLTLNVWAPTTALPADKGEAKAKALLPVMVYIHGGGFNIGSAHSYGSMDDLAYSGTALARQGLIVVTVQYRLGALGFFSHKDLGSSADPATGGMNGIRDQIVALQWVQAHIESLGGDPKQVTINGQSAGGESTCILMVSPLVRKGLFHRMMAQSGECIGPWGPQNQTQGFGMGAGLMQTLGVTSLEAMMKLSPSEIVSGGTSFFAVDGLVMPVMPIELWQTQTSFNTKQMLLGSVSLDAMQGP